MSRRRPTRGRQVNRGDRLGELFRQIIAEELERIDREELSLVSVTSVEVDGNLSKAVVSVSNLEPAEDDIVLATLGELRPRLQRAVGNQTRVRRVPPFQFLIDDVLRSAERIDDILRGIEPTVDGAAAAVDDDRAETVVGATMDRADDEGAVESE